MRGVGWTLGLTSVLLCLFPFRCYVYYSACFPSVAIICRLVFVRKGRGSLVWEKPADVLAELHTVESIASRWLTSDLGWVRFLLCARPPLRRAILCLFTVHRSPSLPASPLPASVAIVTSPDSSLD
jgi:hypothetical protein